MLWIPFTLLAATMQSVRTAGQKSLAARTSPLIATWTRYAFGLPFAIAYFAVVWIGRGRPSLDPQPDFWVLCGLASLAQVLATLMLVHVLTLRNFATATTYAKTETVLTALLGVTFFGSQLGPAAWLSVLIGVAGTIFVSIRRSKLSLSDMLNRSLFLGVGAGLGLALTSWWLRGASHSLRTDGLVSAAATLATMCVMQTIMTSAWVLIRERPLIQRIPSARNLCLFVGVTSVAGSVGWFTAMTLQDATYVKALGQIEFVITVAITRFVFREHISRYEWIGMLMIVTAVLALTLER